MEEYTSKLEKNRLHLSKLLNVFFLVDTSESMRIDGKIDSVNKVFIEMIQILRRMQMDHSSEFELRISIMTFEQNARWLVAPTPIMEYKHEDLVCGGNVACFSDAYKKLGEKLTRKEYMAHTGKLAQPYIILITDGESTPDDNYQAALDVLNDNGWFKAAQRFAVLIGTDAINSPKARDAVKQFVTNPIECVISLEEISDLIHPPKTIGPGIIFPTNHQNAVEPDEGDLFLGGMEPFGGCIPDATWDDGTFI